LPACVCDSKGRARVCYLPLARPRWHHTRGRQQRNTNLSVFIASHCGREFQTRRIVPNAEESLTSKGTKSTRPRAALPSKLPKRRSSVPPSVTGAESPRPPAESKLCSSTLTSTAESSPFPQALLGAINSPPVAAIPAMSWQLSTRALDAQPLAAQSGAHAGATIKANIVAMTTTNVLAGSIRVGIFTRTFPLHATPPRSSRQLSFRRLFLPMAKSIGWGYAAEPQPGPDGACAQSWWGWRGSNSRQPV